MLSRLVDDSVGREPQLARQLASPFFGFVLGLGEKGLGIADRRLAVVVAARQRRAKTVGSFLDCQSHEHGQDLPQLLSELSGVASFSLAASSHASRTMRPRLAQGTPFGSLAS